MGRDGGTNKQIKARKRACQGETKDVILYDIWLDLSQSSSVRIFVN